MNQPTYTTEQQVRYMGAMYLDDAIGFFLLREEVGTEVWNALFNSFPRGEKTRNKQKARELEQKGDQALREYIDQIDERAAADDEGGVEELLLELDGAAAEYVAARVSQEAADMIARIRAQ